MRSLTVSLPGRSYPIHIAPGCLDSAGGHIRTLCPRATKLFVVTDDHVAPLYGPRLHATLTREGFQVGRYVIPAGEGSKCPARLTALWEAMLDFGLTRTDAVVALGGGVVGDLAGFAAATLLRGVDLIQIPTTLLAQVDSSVGGKVAIDLPQGKNLAGAFWQPKGVLMDPDTLTTLDHKTFADGMAEVIKYGCIAQGDFFRFLSAHPSRPAVMGEIEGVLHTCCDIKRQVVEGDERDTGGRMLLNFGHTLGHAYELAGHYQTWTHGQAVAAGMCAAAQLGVTLGVTPPQAVEPIAALCAAFGLPTAIPCTRADYAAAIGLDKKGSGDRIAVILLEDIGHAVAHPMAKEELLALLPG